MDFLKIVFQYIVLLTFTWLSFELATFLFNFELHMPTLYTTVILSCIVMTILKHIELGNKNDF